MEIKIISEPFSIWQILTAVGTVGAVIVALFLPMIQRKRTERRKNYAILSPIYKLIGNLKFSYHREVNKHLERRRNKNQLTDNTELSIYAARSLYRIKQKLAKYLPVCNILPIGVQEAVNEVYYILDFYNLKYFSKEGKPLKISYSLVKEDLAIIEHDYEAIGKEVKKLTPKQHRSRKRKK